MKYETLAIHGGRKRDEGSAIRPVNYPIYLSSTFTQDSLDQFNEFMYTRSNNPTRNNLETLVAQLSGGQQQRVGIARALALKPDVILFDEPTSALDPELVQGVLDVIRRVAEQNITTIIVTHEMAFARDVADRVIFMAGGEVVEEGPARQVITDPKEPRTRRFLTRFLNDQ